MQSLRKLNLRPLRYIKWNGGTRKLKHYKIPAILTSQTNRELANFKSVQIKSFSTDSNCEIDSLTFEKVCEETLESLTEYFEEIVESNERLASGDVSYSSGVLTVNLGKEYGTYVINRQSPNRQIWLSSPTSGPKRYDFNSLENCWIYKHDSQSLHQILQNEISKIVKNVDFSKCLYSKL